MSLSRTTDQCVLNSFGYYELKDKPTEDELNHYYADKYYQASLSTYSASYSKEEIRYFTNKLEQKYLVAKRYLAETGKNSRRFLDVGAGEGWALSFFREKGWECTGLDYSSHGCGTHNPDCLDCLIPGDIYQSVERLIAAGDRGFDVILLDNVLEHVLDPLALLRNVGKLSAPTGMLIVEVPNDFSILQRELIEEGYVSKPYWVAIPDHISYFTRGGLETLCSEAGWSALSFLADYPIEFNLLSEINNYVEKREVGTSCHKTRIKVENFIHSISPEKSNELYSVLSDMGLGRSIIGFFRAG